MARVEKFVMRCIFEGGDTVVTEHGKNGRSAGNFAVKVAPLGDEEPRDCLVQLWLVYRRRAKLAVTVFVPADCPPDFAIGLMKGRGVECFAA